MTNEARAWSWCTAAKSSPCSPQLEKAHIVAMMTQHSSKQEGPELSAAPFGRPEPQSQLPLLAQRPQPLPGLTK
ncbi:hypothetical protein R6Z07M_018989 [Ovis aries]